ncbi:precorrin-6A/cobalt-precorrin-6A reductase [Tateyamaria sp.]|uniref:precorrin-6A/cobalt-precorrin-6A reductase n=1 Tax=Tateyamaria sp. TaxID=1929288 RepID=UPI00329AAAB3
MIKRPLIALLAGAREAQDAAVWLTQADADCVVIRARGSAQIPLDMAEAAQVPRDVQGILDVTHSFDEQTRQAALLRAPDASYACVPRDVWAAQKGDHWTEVDTLEQAVSALPLGARVFAATGRDSLSALHRHDGPVFLRQLSQHSDATGYDNCTFVFGVAPFAVSDEIALLQKLRIDVVLARNIGGEGSFPKLAAARALGLPAVLLRPPVRPEGARLRSAKDVADWVDAL